MNYINELMFETDHLSLEDDDLNLDEPSLDGVHDCPRCGVEVEAADDLEHIEKHGVCPSCLSDLALKAAEDVMDL